MKPGTEEEARCPRTPLGAGGEFDLVRRLLEEVPSSHPSIRVGPGDDAAVVDPGGWVVTSDATVEDVHFRRGWLTLPQLGYRAVTVALSDLAAMAAEPVGVMVSFALVRGTAEEWIPELAQGIREACDGAGAGLLGGDVTASPGPLFMDVTALGRADAPVLRSGSRPGDELWVTGRLGGSAGAVRAWEEGRSPPRPLRDAFVRPPARLAEARWLARTGSIRALIDLSDGLAGDAGHLSAAGGVRLVLEAERIPVEPAVEAQMEEAGEALRLALFGGEDYELLLAAEAGALDPFREEFSVRFGLPLTRVGRVEEGEGVSLVRPGEGDGERLEEGGFSHFPSGGTGG